MSKPNLDRLLPDPDSQESLLAAADAFLAESMSAAERQQMRAACSTPAIKLAYENLYFDGTGMENPALFLQRILVALFMSGGFSSRETAQQISAELRIFAAHHGLDFDAQMEAIRSLPGARARRMGRRRFLVWNALVFILLLLILALLQNLDSGWALLLQLGGLAAVIAAQLLLLYRYLR
jgi:hypothetical protein